MSVSGHPLWGSESELSLFLIQSVMVRFTWSLAHSSWAIVIMEWNGYGASALRDYSTGSFSVPLVWYAFQKIKFPGMLIEILKISEAITFFGTIGSLSVVWKVRVIHPLPYLSHSGTSYANLLKAWSQTVLAFLNLGKINLFSVFQMKSVLLKLGHLSCCSGHNLLC